MARYTALQRRTEHALDIPRLPATFLQQGTVVMIRHIKRYFAIRSYMLRLSGELVRRFGQRSVYKIDHVTQAVQRGGFSPAFIACAHAAFCSEEDFNAHYQPLGVSCEYYDLRRTIARRYFRGQTDFDARMILNRLGRGKHVSDKFYESGLGEVDGGSGGHHP